MSYQNYEGDLTNISSQQYLPFSNTLKSLNMQNPNTQNMKDLKTLKQPTTLMKDMIKAAQ